MPIQYTFDTDTGTGVTTTSTDVGTNSTNNIFINNNPISIATSITQLKENSELITSHRKAIKSEMDNLADNVYSMINQLNYSIKVITDTNNFLSKYVNTDTSITDNLTYALTTDFTGTDTVINTSLYNNISFNTLFISSMIYFENFAKILIEAISHYLTYYSTETLSIYTIYSRYCTDMSIANEWNTYYDKYFSLYTNYKDIFIISGIISTDNMISSQERLFNEYTLYKNCFDNVLTIFYNSTNVISLTTLTDSMIPATQGIINFKSGSTLYNKYLSVLSNVINETSNLFNRLVSYTSIVSDHNIEYQPMFKEDNTYVTTMIEICTNSNDLLSYLLLKYPSLTTQQYLITDDDFTQVLTTINNLFKRELETMIQLVDQTAQDYKLIRSLETFITSETSITNSTLFTIMDNYDTEIKGNDNLLPLLTLYFNQDDDNNFNTNSFTQKLINLNILTEPMYDILNYYRLFLYPFLSTNTAGASLIFDFLETLFIYNKEITNQDFNTAMKDLFEIKINNIDYINVNASKLNETITSKYNGLSYLNYFDIQPYIDLINTTVFNWDEITLADLINLFSTITTINYINFSITENLLYNNLNINKVIEILSIPNNIRTLLTKLFFITNINTLISTITTYYGGNTNDIPTNLSLYTELTSISTDFIEDLAYLKTLIQAKDYYNGNSTIFNNTKIQDFSTPGDSIWIDDEDTKTLLSQIFQIHKEV